MKKAILGCLILIFWLGSIAEAPILPYYWLKVRILAYSPKQPREGHKTATGKSARNEIGASCHKSFLPLGSVIEWRGQKRIIDDRTPFKAVKIIGTNNLIELRWYESIKAKQKTRAVNKELRKRFDGGWGIVKVWK